MSKLLRHTSLDAGYTPEMTSQPWGFMPSEGGVRIAARTVDSLDDVREYSIFGGNRFQGRVFAYDRGLKLNGWGSSESLPFDITRLVGEGGAELLERLSLVRKNIYEGVGHPLDPYFKTMEEQEAHRMLGRSMGGYFTSDPESFRRHWLVLRRRDDSLEKLDFKIPGEDEVHHNVSPYNFEACVDVFSTSLKNGVDPLMPAPYFFVILPQEIDQMIYGRLRKHGVRGEPWKSNYMVMQHLDGQRIIRQPKEPQASYDIVSRHYLMRVSERSGRQVEDVMGEAAVVPLHFLQRVHDAGYVLGADNHFNNYKLCLDGHTRSAGDLGDAKPEKDVTDRRQGVDVDRRICESAALQFLRNLHRNGIKPVMPDMGLPEFVQDKKEIARMFR